MSTVIRILDRRMAKAERSARGWAAKIIAEGGIEYPEAYIAEVVATFLDAEREQHEEVACRSAVM